MYHVLVILPDSWKTPNDLIWIPGMVSGWNTNTYSESQWFQMECAGAICLPASSTYSVYGEDVIVGPVGKEGCYWSVSHNDEKYAYGLYFDNETLYPYVDDWFRRSDGLSIRPVQDVK